MSGAEMMRNQRWRLGIIRHVEEVTHNVAKTCRYYGISRMVFYRWYRRYQGEGIEGILNEGQLLTINILGNNLQSPREN